MPGLAFSLGMRVGPQGLPARLAEQRKGVGWVMAWDIEPGVLVAQHAIIGPDNVRLMTLGKLPGHVSPGSSAAFKHVLGFHVPGWSVVGDLAAGTRQAFFGWAGFADTVVFVVEPTAKAILSARRLTRLRSSLSAARFVVVANKTHRREDAQLVRDSLELPLVGTVPYDELVRDAEREGRAPIDAVPQAPAMQAVGRLLQALEVTG